MYLYLIDSGFCHRSWKNPFEVDHGPNTPITPITPFQLSFQEIIHHLLPLVAFPTPLRSLSEVAAYDARMDGAHMHTLLAQLQTKRVGKALQGIPGVVKCEKRLVVEGRDLYYPVLLVS